MWDLSVCVWEEALLLLLASILVSGHTAPGTIFCLVVWKKKKKHETDFSLTKLNIHFFFVSDDVLSLSWIPWLHPSLSTYAVTMGGSEIRRT